MRGMTLRPIEMPWVALSGKTQSADLGKATEGLAPYPPDFV